MKLKIGIFFGGMSREREVSFAGGRTVYDNLDKGLFEAVPIFVDSLGNFILLDWQFIYKGTIRDFYPPVGRYPEVGLPGTKQLPFQIYAESLRLASREEARALAQEVGKVLSPDQLAQEIDFAFLALHGAFGEDGSIQGMLEWYGIPYSGTGILGSAIGIDKAQQSSWMQAQGFARPQQQLLAYSDFKRYRNTAWKNYVEELKTHIGFPLVMKNPRQGSSIGVHILKEADPDLLASSLEKSFFRERMQAGQWQGMSKSEHQEYIIRFTDIREGLGFPVWIESEDTAEALYEPWSLYDFLNTQLAQAPADKEIIFRAHDAEDSVLLESFLEGTEFSCIVLKPDGQPPLALPPTEIVKSRTFFDYRSKYLPGTSRKITPIRASTEIIEQIREECCRLFDGLSMEVYARIDGFLTAKGQIILNDPNTTSGMMPSSFFFHQAAEIGLNARDFLTFIIRTSLQNRAQGTMRPTSEALLESLDQKLRLQSEEKAEKTRVGVIMGGYSTERHISMESGRNIYEKLASSSQYLPIPIFLSGSAEAFSLHALPVRYMLKDHADDIRDKLRAYEADEMHPEREALLHKIREEAQEITQKYAGETLLKPLALSMEDLAQRVDLVFIALHGRPGEDGHLQKQLEAWDIPYNGSGIQSSEITINKYITNERLRTHGIRVAEHFLFEAAPWMDAPIAYLDQLEDRITYPLIAKPADEGCSSAVKKIRSREALEAYARICFRDEEAFPPQESQLLGLGADEPFPQKPFFLVEELIESKGAELFMEITGGLLTHWDIDASTGERKRRYEIFEPSQALAQGEILSLEEKFLAGEGQNITPAVYSKDPGINAHIAALVKQELHKVAKLLDVEGYARIDAFVRQYPGKDPEIIVIEINSLPGMTPATCIFHQAALNDYKPYQFIDRILKFALGKKPLQA